MPRSWCRSRNGRSGWTTPIWAATAGAVHRYFLNARRIFADIAEEVHRFKPGAEVAPGIVSIPAYGHTPGHTAFAIHSGKASLLVMSDTVRNPYLFVRHPDWQPIFDMDGPLVGESAPRHARPRRRRPHAGRGLSLPLPGLRPHRQERRGLRARAGDVGAAISSLGARRRTRRSPAARSRSGSGSGG